MADMILQKKQQEFFAKNNPQKNILVSVTKIWQNNSSKNDFCKNKNRIYHNFSPKNIITNNPNMHHINSISVQN
jgi:hypothetical protein